MFLFRPFRAKTDGACTSKRIGKTPGNLHRLLSEEFERSRQCECTCKMPVVFPAEPREEGAPNWDIEMLWCGCPECRRALNEVLERHRALYDLKAPPPPADSE